MGDQTDPDKAWIVTQVLHRGWASPKTRFGPMQFPVKRSELRNPEVEVPPPQGIPEDASVAWIYITQAKAQTRITLNRFHVRAFENTFPALQGVLRSAINEADIPRKTRKISISMVRS
jgi:hypothetical protein